MQRLCSVQWQLFGGYQDDNNHRIIAAAAVLKTCHLSTVLKSICTKKSFLRFSSLKRLRFSK